MALSSLGWKTSVPSKTICRGSAENERKKETPLSLSDVCLGALGERKRCAEGSGEAGAD